jgi:hypothetical protein
VAEVAVSVAARRVPFGPALDDAATGLWLRRYRRHGLLLVLAGLALVLGPLVNSVVDGAHAAWLLCHGARTSGMVARVSQSRGGEGSIDVDYRVGQRLRSSGISLAGLAAVRAAAQRAPRGQNQLAATRTRAASQLNLRIPA